MSITGKGKKWEILHSLWIGWTFTLGFFNWIAFLSIGWRARQGKWIFWALFYSVPFVLAMGFGIGTSGEPVSLRWLGDWNVTLTILLGIVSIFHAFKVRNEYLMRLADVQGTKRRREGILKRLLRNEGSLRGEGLQRTSYASKETPLYKALLNVCSEHTRNDWTGYCVGEKVPLKKMANAFAYYPIPDDERIVALLDTSAFGSGKSGLAICKGGIYWRNPLFTDLKKRTFLSWDDFESVHLKKNKKLSWVRTTYAICLGPVSRKIG